MALIRCTECGKEISDKAKHCIFCGYPLNNASANSFRVKAEANTKDEIIEPIHIIDSKEEKERKIHSKISLTILLIVLSVIVFIGMYPKVIVPSLRYKQAEAHYAKGEYETAVQIYEQLGNYKESEQRLQKIEGILNPVVISVYSDEKFVYAFYSNDTVEINSYVGSESEVHIPAIIDGATVRIADEAFYNCDSLETLIIEDGVTFIGEKAFAYCDNLQSVAVPSSVTSIGNGAFYQTGVNTVALNGCGVVGDAAFYNCDSLRTLTITDGVTSIGEKAFAYCDNLESFDFPSSVTSIGNGAFKETNVKTVSIKNGVIADEAFYNCDSLETLIIEDGITSIGKKAFAYCDNLKSISLGSAEIDIDETVFDGCKNLRNIPF